MRFRLRTLLAIPAVLAVTVVGIASIPRTTTVLNNENWSAKYTGLDWTSGRSIFGRRYYEFTVNDLPQRTWVIRYHGGDWGDAVANYPNGDIALTGRCRIERTDTRVYPLFDDLSDAISYTPSGEFAAKVTDGMGKAVLFYPDGTKNWEMTYDGFERTTWVHFDVNGNVRSSSSVAAGDGG
ncbi:hypothetical protein Q31b_50390 [Novipirellula aureliae]|uniref:MORN repeat variant n=1 Tax=Novipirellula aureliae TaxID=2527966 RepID=A0A5C6DHU1_9BACT|nr:hypothetical protein [Novipirellula aureliae]TWU35604.1 hypothetical protein Q31b_50390 [Novipirellula aureliae]